jgi:type I restriction enzyme S subunit
LGSVARVPSFIDVGRMTQDTVKLIFKSKAIDRSYLYWILRTPEYREYCRARGMGTTNLSMSRDDFLSFRVPEPTAARLCILRTLDAVESKIALIRDIGQTLEALAQAIFKSWFLDFDPVKAKIAAIQGGRDPLRAAMSAISGKAAVELDALPREQYAQLAATAALFPAEMEESELGEIPRGWTVKSLGDVAHFASGKVNVSSLSHDNYISTENMLENRGGVVRASSLPSVATVPSFTAGQVLVSNIRPYFKKIWLARLDGGRSPDVLAFTPADLQCSEFLYSLIYQDSFFEFMTRTAKGAKMPRGDKDAIIGWRFPCPSDGLMTHFSERVRPHCEHMANLSSEKTSLVELRDTLLPEFLSGELLITEAMAEDEA